MIDPALNALLDRREALEQTLSRIDVWLLVFGVFVVIGVGGESVFGIRAWWNNRKLHTIQQSIEGLRQAETARFNKEAADANERAANAEKSAAEAKLALERLRTPRTLDKAAMERIADKLRSFSGQQFDVALNVEPEPQKLLGQIEDTLKMAGWKQIDWKVQGIITTQFTRANRPEAGIVSIVGIAVQMHPEQIPIFGLPAKSLADALLAEGIEARAETGSGTPNANNNAIHILVGSKPQ